MKLKSQRNLWVFAGLCFSLAIILNIVGGKTIGLLYILLSVSSIASFINAYNAHRKILH
jgi:hypothetical protein